MRLQRMLISTWMFYTIHVFPLWYRVTLKYGAGACSSKNRVGSRSSRITAHANKCNADVNNADIKEDKFSNRHDATALDDSHKDDDVFSIVNNFDYEKENTLAEEN